MSAVKKVIDALKTAATLMVLTSVAAILGIVSTAMAILVTVSKCYEN